MPDSWTLAIALRYTLNRTGNQLVSFMSLISMAGLVLGVTVLLVVLSVMNGFERELRENVLSVLPHGSIEGRPELNDWQGLAQTLGQQSRIEATAPFVRGTGLLVASSQLHAIAYTGIEPTLEARVSEIEQYMRSGSLEDLTAARWGVVIGAETAAALNLGMGDKVSLILPEASMSLAGPVPRRRQLTVVGVFETRADLDGQMVYLHLPDAARLLRLQAVQGLRVKVDNLFDAPDILWRQLVALDRSDLFARSWMGTHGNLYRAIQIQKTTMFLLLFLLIAVAAFNVVANLVMTVDDRSGDIAILKTMGAKDGAVLAIFVLHGAMVGLVGVVLGLLLGALTALNVSGLYAWVDGVAELNLMGEYFIHYLPSQLQLADVVLVGMGSFVICLLATVYPAVKAARALPVETLQYEV